MGKGFVPNTEKRNSVLSSWFHSGCLSSLPPGARFPAHLLSPIMTLQITLNLSQIRYISAPSAAYAEIILQ